MSDFRRFQPRHGASAGNGVSRRMVMFGIAAVVIILIVVLWRGRGGSPSASNSNASGGISLVTDNANRATNSTTNTNTSAPAVISGSWKGFSVKSCPSAISSFGTKKQVVFTIGLTYANDVAGEVLTALKTAGVPADFLSTGSFAEKNADFVKSVSEAGYAVYSQNYDSTDMAKLSDADAVTGITKAETAIADATGISPKPVFRPPFGSYTAQTVKLLNEQGYCAILWTVDAYDWNDETTPEDAQARVMAALEKQTGGAIIALHAGYNMTPKLITDLVTAIKDKGFEFVTLATLLNNPS